PDVAAQAQPVGVRELGLAAVGAPGRGIIDGAAGPAAVGPRSQAPEHLEADDGAGAELRSGVLAIAQRAPICIERPPQPDDASAEPVATGRDLDLRGSTLRIPESL